MMEALSAYHTVMELVNMVSNRMEDLTHVVPLVPRTVAACCMRSLIMEVGIGLRGAPGPGLAGPGSFL